MPPDDDDHAGARSLAEYRAEEIAQRAARIVLRATFRTIGIDPEDPASLERWHAERSWVRQKMELERKGGLEWRKALITAAVALVSSAVATLATLLYHPPGK